MRYITLLAALLSFHGSACAVDALTGWWKGTLETPNGPLEVIAVFEPDGEGGWGGSVDTPAQSSYGVPWSSVAFDGTSLVAEIETTGARWQARMVDGPALEGTWSQRGAQLPLRCERIETPGAVPDAIAQALVGTWEGKLDAGAVQLRVTLELERTAAGTVVGSLFSPDQTPQPFPIGRTDDAGDQTVLIRCGMIGATAEVRLAEDGQSLAGRYRQGFQAFDITFDRVESATKVRRPQEPVPPFPYRSEDVIYRNQAADVTLAGTLTIPDGDGPFPAALLITGSGAQDRNEEIFQHKPFLVIADHLTRNGIAVLRVDDRGVGGSTAGANPGSATSFDFATDVETGIDYLRARPEIANDRIGLIGHSEGGVIAPIVAARNEHVAFIIMLAGTGVRGDELLCMQHELIMRVSGESEEKIAAGVATQRATLDVVIDESISADEARARMRALIEANPDYQAATEQEQETTMQVALTQLASPWVITFARHDPRPTLEQVSCPVLALCGELDVQVPYEANLAEIRAALRRGGNRDITTRSFPGMNHLFQHATTGLVEEYGQIEETFAVEVLDLMTDWINRRFSNG